ncbi:CLUMA_CG010467, isoform A [Clunio marinus]|uniref:CLUMA_CG010467, isoform A n=1 Tax=Clunio marinus TaxID=568069 RepID=A0A1J1IDL9_9DIPT|nr:CLUMA_CG010467, isoform A [Clunio marinus]
MFCGQHGNDEGKNLTNSYTCEYREESFCLHSTNTNAVRMEEKKRQNGWYVRVDIKGMKNNNNNNSNNKLKAESAEQGIIIFSVYYEEERECSANSVTWVTSSYQINLFTFIRMSFLFNSHDKSALV